MTDETKPTMRPEPPAGVRSDFAPPVAPKSEQIHDAIARFDAEVAKAKAKPSRALQALHLAELVKSDLPEELRAHFEQYKYEVFAREDGGLGLHINPRRDKGALNMLVTIRQTAERILTSKRQMIANPGSL